MPGKIQIREVKPIWWKSKSGYSMAGFLPFIPCLRVVAASGKIGGFFAKLPWKKCC